MKEFFKFLRSMKFGIILLILVMFFSFLGSLIPQGRETDWYIRNYTNTGMLIAAFNIHNIFYSWYFVVLIGLLCVNLTLCSLIRFNSVRRMKKNALNLTGGEQKEHFISSETASKLCESLVKKGYRRRDTETYSVFYKNMMGYYGSFTVHLSILLTLVFGGIVLGFSKVTDYNVMPGNAQTLPDGTQLTVESFRLTDKTGRTDYASVIQVTAPNGTQSAPVEIKVNYPFTFKTHKYYQHSYGTAGSVTAKNIKTGGEDIFYLTERSFLSVDGRNGIWFEALYPSYVKDDDGHIMPISYLDGTYPNPVYRALASNNGSMTPITAFPEDDVEAGDIVFTFNEPVSYPGIRVKDIPKPFPMLLYASFVLMTLGFWLCFFHIPAVVVVRRESYSVLDSRMSGAHHDIEDFLYTIDKEEGNQC